VALRRTFREGPQPAITPAPAPGPDTAASLDGSWTVTSYADGTGSLVEPVVGTTPTLTFFAVQGRYKLNSGCDSLEGGFIARGTAIEFVDANRMHAWGCSPSLESQGDALVKAVMASTRFGVLGLRGLTLSDRYEDALASFTRAEPPEGRDIGLDTPLCDLQRLGGVDMIGDGSRGTAWTGVYVEEDGSCPTRAFPKYVVTVDVDGDGRADSAQYLKTCQGCEPYVTTDFDADGIDELVVLTQASSTPTYEVFYWLGAGSPRSAGIYAVGVESPGAPAAGFPADQDFTITAGGDEGFSSAIICEGYPTDPILVVAYGIQPIEGATREVHVTRLQLGGQDEGKVFSIVSADHLTQPTNDPLPFESSGWACGVKWDPFS
jgi:hypothetical protein